MCGTMPVSLAMVARSSPLSGPSSAVRCKRRPPQSTSAPGCCASRRIGACWASCSCERGWHRVRVACGEQHDMEDGTAVGPVGCMDAPPMCFDDLAAYRQAQARSAGSIARLARLHEGLEHGLQLCGRNARALIAHLDVDAVVVRDSGGDVDDAVFGRELDGVAQYIAHHLLKARWIHFGDQRHA